MLAYTGAAIVESACTSIPVASQMIGTDGLIADPGVREQIGKVLALLAEAYEEVTGLDRGQRP
ncbi:hypothetical protein [Streptomyces sp. NBC_01408]|uniref:hypothetical protein n=1 Tax=Streptomyces sp. NBC_01408 TaxID=2903855 RepID=UPI00224F7E10|nr:hypothetical protein [Streptomyces sp. NBC_01408]MCX4692360.1 hypothetical protein [Streptomyces sp. NBC_01408]